MMFNRQHTKHNLTLISNVPRFSAKCVIRDSVLYSLCRDIVFLCSFPFILVKGSFFLYVVLPDW